MSQNYYKLYIDSVLELANTIVIKSEYSASTINDWLKFNYGQDAVDPYDKTTWKYYLNLAGRYHPRDAIIYVTSLDNLARITFDRATLENHPATLEAYKYGSRYYTEITTLHPDMEQFILGCLYPADLQKSIAAKDGMVLSYPEHLVEENEESLIPNIEFWISQWNIRWTNPQFNLTDSLYASANLGLMYLNLIPLIINLRLEACKTREVHSYHIRQYLASHGFLDTYIDYLNLKQRLFLYRNIRYIQRNNGKRETFSWLIEKLLTERAIPISEHSMRHDVSMLPENIYPDIGFRRKSLNNVYSPDSTTKPVITLDELLLREERLATGNKEYTLDTKSNILTKFENSLSSVVGTKVLESSMVDYTDSETYTLTEARLSNWLMSSSLGRYEAIISFKEPITSVDKTLNAFDAYIYWFYCYCKSLDINLVNIPELFVYKAIQPVDVTRNDLEVLVDKDFVSEEDIDAIFATKTTSQSMTSVSAFATFINNIYSKFKTQTRIISNNENVFGRGLLQNMANRLYKNKRLDTNAILLANENKSYSTMAAWLEEKGLPVEAYNKDQYKDLYLEIFKNATGADYFTAKTMAELQKALLRLLGELSSYSIQILSDINETNIKKLGWGSIRVSDFKALELPMHEVLIPAIRPEIIEHDTFHEIHIPVIPITENVSIQTHSNDIHPIDIIVKPNFDVIHIHQIRTGVFASVPNEILSTEVNGFLTLDDDPLTLDDDPLSLNSQGSQTVDVSCPGNDPNFVGGIQQLTSFQSFFDLSLEDQMSVKDVYNKISLVDINANKINLNTVIYSNVLESFKLLNISKNKLSSFVYKFIPRTTVNGVKISYTNDLSAFLPNLGKMNLNAYRLFNQEQVIGSFSYFASQSVVAGFKANFEPTTAHPHYLNTYLNFGKEVNFAQSFLGTGVYRHPTLAGQVFNGFSLILDNGSSEYNLVGFTYNGTQLTWS